MTPAQRKRTEQEIVDQERKMQKFVTRKADSLRSLDRIIATEKDPRIIESERATTAIHNRQDDAQIERYTKQIAQLRKMLA